MEIPRILTQTTKELDFCDPGIDETLGDSSSDILKGVIVGVVVGFIILKVLK